MTLVMCKNFDEAVVYLRKMINEVRKNPEKSKGLDFPHVDTHLQGEELTLLEDVYFALSWHWRYMSHYDKDGEYLGEMLNWDNGSPDAAERIFDAFSKCRKKYGAGKAKRLIFNYISKNKEYGRTVSFWEKDDRIYSCGLKDDFQKAVEVYFRKHEVAPKKVADMELVVVEEFWQYVWQIMRA